MSLTTVDRIRSLSDALIAIARPLKGGALFLPDALQLAVLQHCSSHTRDYWGEATRGLEMYGLVRSVPEVAELCRTQGVLTWTKTGGKFVWIVNTDWLTSPADIHAFVTGQGEPGRRCRFCQILEPPTSRELQPVDQSNRGHVAVNGVVQLRTDVAYTHEPCRSQWERWVGIAARHVALPAPEKDHAA